MLDVLLILFLSFAPMLVYACIFWWFDRYEKEPIALLVAAFVWGAIPSIILALIMQLALDIPLTALSPNQLTYDLLGASVSAPLTEEGIKALALIILLLFLRREIDSPMDGLIYGGLVGFGFAAVENFFYLLGAYMEGGVGGVLILTFLRAGLFGLNHAMYTAFSGLGVALTLEVRNKFLKPVFILGGFTLAVVAHSLHNAFATFAAYTNGLTILLAVLTDWGGVLVILAVAIGSYILERKRIVAYAQALVRVQAIPKAEIDVLKSTFRRRIARLRLLLTGEIKLWWKTTRYQHKVSEAAFAWHRMNHGDEKAQKHLIRLEKEFLALRQSLTSNGDVAVQ